jgi:GNAT superfamily N-acetyltransferase
MLPVDIDGIQLAPDNLTEDRFRQKSGYYREYPAMFTVRPYTRADYDDFVRIDAATQSTAFWGEADWQPVHPPRDETPDAKRYVAVHTVTSQVVGYGAVLLAEQSNLDVMVHPEWQRRGVGETLWERMRRDLSAALGTATVGPWVRAGNDAACGWLEAMGFVQVHQDGAVQLLVADADLTPFAAVAGRLAERGIVITTLAAEGEKTPDCRAKFYELFQEVEKDVPGYSPATKTTYAQSMQELEQPGMTPESVFIATHDGEYVGLSILRRKVTPQDIRFAGGPDCLSQHLTGVRPDHRRRGIALALKLRTVEYAQRHGFRRILSNSDNPAMQDLNRKLGFRTGPWLIYNKTIG